MVIEPDALRIAFAAPLENKQVPTLSQFQNWLASDQTNTIQYNPPDFVCKDFAATLVVHARAQELQMGLVFVRGYDVNSHQDWNHAFNAIVTTEGLVYVEPQDDGVWWYADHAAIQSGKDYMIGQYNPAAIHVNDIKTVVNY